MGCNVSVIRLDPQKIKTVEQVRRFFNDAVSEASVRYGNDGYSGEWNTLMSISFTNKQFESLEAADEYMSEHTEKRTATVAQIKTFKEGKLILNAKQDLRFAGLQLRAASAEGVDPASKEHKALTKIYQKAKAKIEKLELAAAQRSNKFAWVICAACAE